MRVEIEVAEAGHPGRFEPSASAASEPRRRRIDRFEVSVLVAFAAVSVWVLALDLWQVVAHGAVWTGTDGVYLVDQMQYLAWIRDASHHLFASNLFVLRSTPNDYFQPLVVISGGLSALGVAPWLSMLLWKPVAVGTAFWAVRRYAHRSVSGLWQRRAVLVLALFFGSFTVAYGSFTVLGDLFPGFLSWGYTFGLIAIAAIVGAFVLYDRARAHGRIAWWPGILGALASLMHPWNGELLIGVVIIAELIMWRRWRNAPRQLAMAALTVSLTVLPLLYYVLLTRVDRSWHLARAASKHSSLLWPTLLAIAPLLLPALAGYRRRAVTYLDAATRAWPLAALALCILSATQLGATPLHAFQGITIPLAVLAVEGVQLLGWRRLPHKRLVGVVAVAAFTIPATALELKTARDLAKPTPDNSNFIAKDEKRALNYLAKQPGRGGVLTRSYLGALVPAVTGRHTFIGDCLWSQPHCYRRGTRSRMLFDGALAPAAARRFVKRTHATFVLADCEATPALRAILRPIARSVHRFGCAAVYRVD
jgi:hypothetical protein